MALICCIAIESQEIIVCLLLQRWLIALKLQWRYKDTCTFILLYLLKKYMYCCLSIEIDDDHLFISGWEGVGKWGYLCVRKWLMRPIWARNMQGHLGPATAVTASGLMICSFLVCRFRSAAAVWFISWSSAPLWTAERQFGRSAAASSQDLCQTLSVGVFEA